MIFVCCLGGGGAVSAIGGECSARSHEDGGPEATGECDERDTVLWDGSGRDLQSVDKEWLEKFERMGRRAFPYEHAERVKTEKRLAAKKKNKQTKIRRYMKKVAK